VKNVNRLLATLSIAVFTAVSCAPPLLDEPAGGPDQPVSSDQPTLQATEPAVDAGAVEVGLAVVDSIDILIMESMPVQVNVVARGNLPDGCTSIGQAATEREDRTFVVTLPTRRPLDAMCTEALVPYEQAVPLEVAGLPAGVYTVTVNGVSDTFELAMDNVLPTEQAPS